MSTTQGILFTLIGALFVFLIWSRYRRDRLACGAMLIAYLLGADSHRRDVFQALLLRGLNTPLVLEILAVATAIPMIVLVWPLRASAPRSAHPLFCAAPAA